MQRIKNITISLYRYQTLIFQKENFVQFVVLFQIIHVFSADLDTVVLSVIKLTRIQGKKFNILTKN